MAPLAVGVSLVLDLFAAAAYSGGGVSPARVLGPAIVFHCHWNTAWVYMLAGQCLQFAHTVLVRLSFQSTPMYANSVHHMSLLKDSSLLSHCWSAFPFDLCHFKCSPRGVTGQGFNVFGTVIDIAVTMLSRVPCVKGA